MNIFTLTGNILVDNAKANDSIQKTDSLAEKLSGKLGSGIKTAAKWGAALTAGAAAAAGAVGAVVNKAVEATGALDDTSKKVGMTAEEFQKYAYAAKLSGMESATLEKAMIKQQKAFADAKTGSKSAGEAYKALGVDISKISSSGQSFDIVIKKLADIKDATKRDALANKIFGKSYAELAPLLSEGADGIEKLKQEAVDMGAVISNDSVASGAKFGDMLDSVKMSLNTAVVELGVEFMPILQEVLDWVIDNMPEIKRTMKDVFRTIKDVVKEAGDIFKAMKPILKALYDYAAWVFPLISDAIQLACGIITSVAKGVSDAFDDIATKIQLAINKLSEWNGKKIENKHATVTYDNGRTGGGGSGQAGRNHASGLAYVPYDGYQATLHKGERVLTRGEASQASTVNHTGTIIVKGVNNQDELVAVVEQNITNNIITGNRRIPNKTSLIPIT